MKFHQKMICDEPWLRIAHRVSWQDRPRARVDI
jgi:hypothetical protein